jgi:hypothetical protein
MRYIFGVGLLLVLATSIALAQQPTPTERAKACHGQKCLALTDEQATKLEQKTRVMERVMQEKVEPRAARQAKALHQQKGQCLRARLGACAEMTERKAGFCEKARARQQQRACPQDEATR